MFKQYKDLSDVVSLLVYCPSERSFLLSREASGEFWIPSCKSDRNCWKLSAQKINLEVFGVEATAGTAGATGATGAAGAAGAPAPQPLRVCKVWLPAPARACVHHAVYKVPVKADVKRRTKAKLGANRASATAPGGGRLQWVGWEELQRARAHRALRSPELALLAAMAVGGQDQDHHDMDSGVLVEICEEDVLVGAGAAAGCPLLRAAGYTRDDQVRVYKTFLQLVFPAQYMGAHAFAQLMLELGWPRSSAGIGPAAPAAAAPASPASPASPATPATPASAASSASALFRAADAAGRGGLSCAELAQWLAALEPATPHAGLAAEMRCRYIFRYFDADRDSRLQYEELKELVAATRAARGLPADALAAARHADQCLRQLGLQPNSPLPLAEFLRGATLPTADGAELQLRGASALLRAPRALATYLLDLQERECSSMASCPSKQTTPACDEQLERGSSAGRAGHDGHVGVAAVAGVPGAAGVADGAGRAAPASRGDYSVAAYTVKLRQKAPYEMLELRHFEEEAVSASTARLVEAGSGAAGGGGGGGSLQLLAPSAAPAEALAAVRYFAAPVDRLATRRASSGGPGGASKPAWAWATPAEEASLGALLLRLAEAVRPICAAEPRLLRINSPVYVIGDLHGNLAAWLAMEAALWPLGAALAPARLLLLGDYVDRGPHGAELLAALLAAKLQRPRALLLLRGNHEIRDIQKMFTFHAECLNKYGETEGARIWSAVNQVFDVLPLAAVVDDKVFCCHGGIPPPWVCPLIAAIDKVPVPLPRPAEQSSLAWELLWNDPVKPHRTTATLALELTANEGFAANTRRGTGHVFDQSALDRFLLANHLSHVLRAHELHHAGFMCQLRGRLVSVFSSARYCGGSNRAALALLHDRRLRLLTLTTHPPLPDQPLSRPLDAND